jgi:hypothetical protein
VSLEDGYDAMQGRNRKFGGLAEVRKAPPGRADREQFEDAECLLERFQLCVLQVRAALSETAITVDEHGQSTLPGTQQVESRSSLETEYKNLVQRYLRTTSTPPSAKAGQTLAPGHAASSGMGGESGGALGPRSLGH